MKRLEITYSRENKDLVGKSRQEAREYYLNLYGNFSKLARGTYIFHSTRTG